MPSVDARTLDRMYADHVDDLRRRYAEVLETQGWDAVVIHSGALVPRSAFDDQVWPLRAVPHWRHWLPLTEPDFALVVRAGARPTLLRLATASFWEQSARPETEAFLEVMDTLDVTSLEQMARHVPAGRVAFIGDPAARATLWGIDGDAVCPGPLVGALDALRVVKTPYEVACLSEANRRARAGHDALRHAFGTSDASELDLHLSYLRATAQDDPETPYKNIVAMGPNAATLHHVAYARSPIRREAESLLVDAGASCRGYGADVTRTWIKGSGAAAELFGQLVKAVDALQRALCDAVRVGMPYERLHDEAHVRLATILCDIGLVVGSADEAVGRGVTRAFLPHGLGHSLGLQTHDVGCALRRPRGDNRFLRNTADIAPGQVFTIEPGVYFIGALLDPLRGSSQGALVNWKTVELLAPLGGVRIEDDVHVLAAGAPVRNLTREHLPFAGGDP
jgi:Xaa-Pro dipeptidase